MISVCLTGYIQNGNTLEKKTAYIKYLLINPASIKDKFPKVLFISMLSSLYCRYINCSVSKNFPYRDL